MSEDTQAPAPLAGQTRADLEAFCTGAGLPRFRAAQIYRAVQAECRLDMEEVTTLPLAMRTKIMERFGPPATETVEVQVSDDGTRKYLFALHDGKRIEAVMIPEGKRKTVCVSSQVGCPVRCIFCASGVEGLIRNLSTAEIVEQLLRVTADLGERPTNIVMMGMREPLLNLDAVTDAIRLWTDKDGLNFSPRRITVSTAGTATRIDRLAGADLGVHLAISLHGSDDKSRAALVPGSPEGRVQQLIDAAARYARKTKRDATVEYVLIAGMNDQLRHAEYLADAIQGRHIHVNLIPLNPVKHRPDLRPPSIRDARAFAECLEHWHVSVTLRTQRGEDIDAACGQLALERSILDA